MPLVFTLAFRNLFHDRLRFIATVIGIVFSIVLVTVQMGLYLGFGQMVTTMIDHASADLWIMPKGTKCFEDPSLLDTRQRSRALSIPGVGRGDPGGDRLCRLADAERLARRRCSSSARICASGGLEPWNWWKAASSRSSTPNAVAVDRTYFDRLGISGLGARAEIRQQSVRVAAVTERHPLVHDDALRVHGRRPGARPHRRAVEQGHLFPGARRPGRRRRAGPPRSPGARSPTSRC